MSSEAMIRSQRSIHGRYRRMLYLLSAFTIDSTKSVAHAQVYVARSSCHA